jgi:hypothetical protein
MKSVKEWIDFLKRNPEVWDKRTAITDKIKEIDEALRLKKKVRICIPLEKIDSIAIEGYDDDRIYINDLGTTIFWEDLEKAEICIQ